MENSTSPQAPISPAALLQRQIGDWDLLRTELQAKQEATPTPETERDIRYCTQIIEALTAELNDRP